MRRFRSVPIAEIERVLAVPGVTFVSIERGLAASEIERLTKRYNFIHLGDEVEKDLGHPPFYKERR